MSTTTKTALSKKRRRQIIAALREDIRRSKESGEAADCASYGYEEGILLSRNEATAILELLLEKP